MYHTGGYGYVFIAQDIKTGEDFALKVCSNHPVSPPSIRFTAPIVVSFGSISIEKAVHIHVVQLRNHGLFEPSTTQPARYR